MISWHLFYVYIVVMFMNYGRISDARSLDGQQTDVENMCSHPPNRANSQINLTQEWLPIGTIVNYTCDPGYYLFGDDVRTCKRHNTWSGESPMCLKKVSFGKHVNCTGELTCSLPSASEGLQYVVDNNDGSCFTLPSPGGQQQETFQWTMDLLEEFKQIGAFRFVFQGKSRDIPIVKISLESIHQQPITLKASECSIEQKQLDSDYSEILIRPNVLQSARYVHIFIKTREMAQKTAFCEADVFAEDAPAIHQCFDANKIDGTLESNLALKNTLSFGTSCYTFNNKESNVWMKANQKCITANDGMLAHGITPEVKFALINFLKAQNMITHFWIGGRTQRKNVPGVKGHKVVWEWNNGEEINRAIWNPDQEPAENQCLGINGPSGILLAYSCSSYTGSLCQSAIARCSSPEKNEGAMLVGPRNTHVAAVITYACPEDYRMEGDQVRECQRNGKWSGRAPKCIHKDQKDTDKEKYEMPKGGLIGIIVAGVMVGLLIILIVITVIIVKRRGSFKKTLHFKKHENGESVETLDSKDELKQKENLTESPKENYQSVNGEPQHHEQEIQQQTEIK